MARSLSLTTDNLCFLTIALVLFNLFRMSWILPSTFAAVFVAAVVVGKAKSPVGQGLALTQGISCRLAYRGTELREVLLKADFGIRRPSRGR